MRAEGFSAANVAGMLRWQRVSHIRPLARPPTLSGLKGDTMKPAQGVDAQKVFHLLEPEPVVGSNPQPSCSEAAEPSTVPTFRQKQNPKIGFNAMHFAEIKTKHQVKVRIKYNLTKYELANYSIRLQNAKKRASMTHTYTFVMVNHLLALRFRSRASRSLRRLTFLQHWEQ